MWFSHFFFFLCSLSILPDIGDVFSRFLGCSFLFSRQKYQNFAQNKSRTASEPSFFHPAFLCFVVYFTERTGQFLYFLIQFRQIIGVYGSYVLISKESKIQLLTAERLSNEPSAIICAARLPIAVASVGPAYTVHPVAFAVSSFK